MITDPYQLLGISQNATLDEIKKAYRAKAFLLHPDKNSAPDAQERFIELTEAYEEAITRKTPSFKKYATPFQQAEQRYHQEREAAKRRAREYAQMRYEEFEKTEAAQTLNALNILLNHIMLLLVTAVLLSVPVILSSYLEFTGIILGMIFLLAVARPILLFVKPYFNLSDLWDALMSIVQTFFFRILILSATNIYLFLTIVMQTMLPLYVSLLLLIFSAVLSYFVLFTQKKMIERSFVSFCICPLVVHLVFALNYWFSSGAKIEEYEFNNRTEQGKQTTLIQLEGGMYDQYVGIRLFSSVEPMWFNTHIIYQFEDGLLGVRVMKEYRFIQ
jgi:hypothetical protein